MRNKMRIMIAVVLFIFSMGVFAHEDMLYEPTDFVINFSNGATVRVTLQDTRDKRIKTLKLVINGKEIEFLSSAFSEIRNPDLSSIAILWSGDKKKIPILKNEYYAVTFRYGNKSDIKFGEYPTAMFFYYNDGAKKLTIKEKIAENQYR